MECQVPVKFNHIASEDAVVVELAGSFNDWSRVEMQKGPKEWSITMEMVPGQYQYKFIVDNQWTYNKQKPTTKDSMGHINNVIIVQEKQDLQTREALLAALEAEKSGDGDTALLRAISKDKAEVCGVLLEAGADVNRCNDCDGTSPLIKASTNGNVEIATMLLSAGAQLDQQNKEGDTALTKAAQCGHAHICEILLVAGADISKRNNGYYGETAMDIAKEKNNYEVLEVLEKYRDSIVPLQLSDILNKHETSVENIDKVDDKVGSTPLCFSATIGKEEACKLLIEAGAEVNEGHKGETPLNLAAKNGHADICSMLLEVGADIEIGCIIGDPECYRPLMNAIKFSGNADVVSLLIKAGVDLSKQTSDGQTALCLASRHNRLEIVKLLILHGVQVDLTPEGSSGWTPLMAAAEQGNAEVCKLLMDNGAQLDKQNDNGDTALIKAAEKGQATICEILLSAGADLNKRNNGFYGKTAMDIAQEKNITEVIDELEKYRDAIIPLQLTEVLERHGITNQYINEADKYGNIPLLYAAANGKQEACKLLIDGGADVNKKSNRNQIRREQTALNLAAINEHKDVCQILLDAGAHIDTVCESKDTYKYGQYNWKTPLMHVIERHETFADKYNEKQGSIEMVNFLIKMGADLNKISDMKGNTPLDLAIEAYDANVDIVKALIEGGADVNTTDDYGCTPLMKSTYRHTAEICKLLLEGGANVNAWNEKGMKEQGIKGMTALNMAIYKKKGADFIQVLLDAGATLEYHEEAKPPLFNAIDGACYIEMEDAKQLENIKILIKAGSDVNEQFKGETPLFHDMNRKTSRVVEVKSTSIIDVAELLIEAGSDVDTMYDGETLLTAAVIKDNCEMVQLLLKAGAPVDKENSRGWTALALAADSMYLPHHYNMLINAGANAEKPWEKIQSKGRYWFMAHCEMETFVVSENPVVNIRKSFPTGKTGLFYTASIGEYREASPIIKELKEALCETSEKWTAPKASAAREYIEICTDEGWSPLMAAAYGGHLEMCKLLLDIGAKVNKQSNNGDTALIMAAESGQIDICKLLVKAGAEINNQNNKGDTPLMIVGEKIKSRDFEDIIKMFVTAGAQLNVQNTLGDTVLMKVVDCMCWWPEDIEDICKMLIEAGADLDKQNENGDTALTKAAKLGKANICEVLLVAEGDINRRNYDCYGENALDIAKGKKCSEVIEILEKYQHLIVPLQLGDVLKKHGISENSLDEITKEGHTELHFAASNGKNEACKLLIEAGANVNIMHENDTALNAAAKNGYADVCQMLIDAKAEVDTQDQDGCTPLMNAIRVPDNVDVVKVLIKAGADVNKQNKEGQSPIFLVASHDQGNLDIVEALISGGVEVDLSPSGSLGWTPLMVAAKHGNYKICQLLLNKGAVIDKQNDDGDTAVMIAIENDHLDVCKMLLHSGADVSKQNQQGDTALIKAATVVHDCYEFTQMVLEAGADINKINNDQKTALDISNERPSEYSRSELLEQYKDCIIPLHLAVVNGKVEECEALIDAGTNVYFRSCVETSKYRIVNKVYNNQTLLSLAALNGHEKICMMLLKAGANIEKLIFEMEANQNCSPMMGMLDIIKLLILMGADLNKSNVDGQGYGQTPLYLAVCHNRPDVVKALIEGGADVDYPVWSGGWQELTPLMESAKSGTPEICEILVEAGAQVYRRNYDGNCSLDYAANENIAKILREHAETNI